MKIHYVVFFKAVFNKGVILPSRRHLAIHGEMCGCHSSGHATDICRLEVRNTAKHPIMHGMALHNSKLSGPKCQWC